MRRRTCTPRAARCLQHRWQCRRSGSAQQMATTSNLLTLETFCLLVHLHHHCRRTLRCFFFSASYTPCSTQSTSRFDSGVCGSSILTFIPVMRGNGERYMPCRMHAMTLHIHSCMRECACTGWCVARVRTLEVVHVDRLEALLAEQAAQIGYMENAL